LSANLGALIPDLQPFANELVRAAGAAGLLPRITSTLRTHAEQTRLYRRFLAGAAQYPVAPPGTSAHEYGYAFDMVVSPLGALSDVGRYWRSLGGLWNHADAVHFEYPGFRDDLANGVISPPSGLAEDLNAVGGFLQNPIVSFFTPPILTTKPTNPEITDFAAGIAQNLRDLFGY